MLDGEETFEAIEEVPVETTHGSPEENSNSEPDETATDEDTSEEKKEEEEEQEDYNRNLQKRAKRGNL